MTVLLNERPQVQNDSDFQLHINTCDIRWRLKSPTWSVSIRRSGLEKVSLRSSPGRFHPSSSSSPFSPRLTDTNGQLRCVPRSDIKMTLSVLRTKPERNGFRTPPASQVSDIESSRRRRPVSNTPSVLKMQHREINGNQQSTSGLGGNLTVSDRNWSHLGQLD